MKQNGFLLLVSYDSDNWLSLNFHRFLKSCMCVSTVYSVLFPPRVLFFTGLGKVRSTCIQCLHTHICIWVKTKINIIYPRCKFNISYIMYVVGLHMPGTRLDESLCWKKVWNCNPYPRRFIVWWYFLPPFDNPWNDRFQGAFGNSIFSAREVDQRGLLF